MKVFIPIRVTEVLSENVRKSIEVQGGKIVLVENTPLSTLKNRISEWEARDKIVEMVRGLNDKYVVTNDANAWHWFVDNFECQKRVLYNNAGVGAVGLWRNKTDQGFIMSKVNHVYLSCIMWRREILCRMPALKGNRDPKSCCCHYYGEAVRSMGYEIKFVDSIKRIREIY